MSVRKRRKSQWRPVTRQVRSFLGWAMHRCAICKSPLAKNYILFGTASWLCRMLLLESLVIRSYTRSMLARDQMRFFHRHARLTFSFESYDQNINYSYTYISSYATMFIRNFENFFQIEIGWQKWKMNKNNRRFYFRNKRNKINFQLIFSKNQNWKRKYLNMYLYYSNDKMINIYI